MNKKGLIAESKIYRIKHIDGDLKTITFPKDEWDNVKKRLKDNKIVYSIRIDKEFGKYKLNRVYKTEWNKKVIINKIKHLKNIKDYKFYQYLTKEQINKINNYKKIEVVEIKKFK